MESTGDERVFFALSLDMLCVAGADGYFKRLNPSWTRTLGWSLRHLRSKPFMEFVHPDDREPTQAVFDHLKQGRAAIQFENRYRHRNGSHHWLQWNASWDPDRQLVYAIARDVTGQRSLQRQLLEISERENRLVGAELHDGLCQELAGASVTCLALIDKLQRAGVAESAHVTEIASLLQAAVCQARRIAHGVSPVWLDHLGLMDALTELAREYDGQGGIKCLCTGDTTVKVDDPEIITHLYRIARESIINAIKHSRGTRVDIRLTADDGHGILSVADNGVGFDPSHRNGTGMGLYLLRYRAETIRARLSIKRCSSGGMMVVCRFRQRLKLADSSPSAKS